MVRKLKKIEILEPVIGLQEKKNLNNCFKLNQFSTYGAYANKLERACSQILKTKYNLATTSGSASLYISYKALGIKKDDLVVVPDYAFAANINSIVLNNALPWLIDIKKENLCLDIDLLEKIFQKYLIKKGKFYYHKKEKKKSICRLSGFNSRQYSKS
jgi:dTDP-4-amino-4,6-dideoxygalactose transaminase